MQEHIREEINGPLTTYRDYMSHAGFTFEITAIRVTDERMRTEIGSEWSVTAVCREQPELTFDLNQTDLSGIDAPELIIGRTKDMVRTYLDTHVRTEDSVPDV